MIVRWKQHVLGEKEVRWKSGQVKVYLPADRPGGYPILIIKTGCYLIHLPINEVEVLDD